MSRNAGRFSVSGLLSLALVIGLTLTILPRNNNREGPSVAKNALRSQALGHPEVANTRLDHQSIGGLTTLGSAPQIPRSAQRIGKLNAKQELSVRIVLRPRHEIELSNLVAAISTPGAPKYRQPIGSVEFNKQFSPSETTLHTLSQHLEAAGLTVKPAAHSSLMLAASGSADAVGKLLHASFSSYRLQGRLGYAIDRSPRVNAALGKSVAGLVGLSNLLPRIHHGLAAGASHTKQSQTVGSHATSPAACGAVNAVSSPSGPYAASQLAHAYGLDAAYAGNHLGAGQTVAMYELAPYASSDIRAYTTCYGINPVISKVNVDDGPIGAVSAEPTLDIQMFASLAPSAAIKVYQGPNDAVGPIDVFARIAADNIAEVVSVSWGACEAANGTSSADAENVIFTQMAAQGQTVLAASGDSGSSDCYAMNGDPALSVDDPASQPLVTGVGGTTMTSVGPPPTERVWNDQDPFAGGAGGGGISNTWTRPAWQWGPGTGSESMRQVPDISAAADPSYDMIMYMASYGGWIQIGGTSAASPLLSAAIALTNETCATRVGLINPVLYALSASSATALNDIS
ncbi:MAG: S53 family peptidase, partial [Actinobacteria bacterium]|nr:S53 family peptidase [Actinomycetota bacterium]